MTPAGPNRRIGEEREWLANEKTMKIALDNESPI
jgi:hypothetical protein